MEAAITALPNYDPAASWDQFIAEGGGEMIYRGRRIQKMNADLSRYVRVLEATKPDVIVETGSREYGSAVWFADAGFDVISVDTEPCQPAQGALTSSLPHNVKPIIGNSLSSWVLDDIRQATAGLRTMVILDSDHHSHHVQGEILEYGPLVTPGCLMVVEDGMFDLQPEDQARRGGQMIPNIGGPLHAVGVTRLADSPHWSRATEIEGMSNVGTNPAGWWIRRD